MARYPAQLAGQAGAGGSTPLAAGFTEVARPHHGSMSREQRSEVEEALKSGRLPCVVATSSLELGIDMGAVDLVVQVESPPSVASGLQRIGRAGHQVGAASTGVVLPKHRGDLLPCAVVAERMAAGAIEALPSPATRSTCWRNTWWRWCRSSRGTRGAAGAGPTRGAVLEPAVQCLRGCARHAGGALSVRRVRRAAPAAGLGPGRRHLDGTSRSSATCGHQRRHDP